ncbi:Fur family transcriptional regulator [Thermospira aquatica]|uniref:Transcriptional repressor n=1 Tax=Thermospira aquatica TaxID=2828656 RepID=A0AAX3BCA2_9SPIR|nr:transcriptional repressor [Thermospira aquatica]URA09624.1 transcriptional repressor [Thermospira aquatica]
MPTYKKSHIRDAVLQVLRSTKTHPSAEWVWQEVKKMYPSVTLATVYRNLHILEAQGQVLVLDVGQGERRYDGFTCHHGHFVCRKCGEVFDFDLKTKPWMAREIPGEIESWQVIFYGVCHKCAANRTFFSQ